MRRSLIPAAALVAAMAGSLVLAPAAFASEGPKPLPLHQVESLPLTAGEFDKKGDCPTVPAGKDGWHFVLPGSGKGESAVFTKLTVEFEPGGEQTITVFGPPSDKHAYATSEPGAKLVSASAEVNGTVDQGWFNLSHTCPAGVSTTPSGTPSGTPSETPSGTPSETPSETTPGTPTETPSETTPGGTESPSETPGGTESPSETPGGTESPSPSETPGGTESPSATAPAGETAGTGTGGTDSKGEGDLAETGSGAPVGVLAAVAVALAGAGAFLVTRRRKAQQG
ncbi:LPXTG cell wall anchor domain-containing protein [Streptomyces sp. NPDC018338]|uniref:LPXTG cell wall anchor domain-containing protein n=1 Tax=Streptomyces sp. NPDC018338 TaxID=3157192 RepID=UPI0033E73E72